MEIQEKGGMTQIGTWKYETKYMWSRAYGGLIYRLKLALLSTFDDNFSERFDMKEVVFKQLSLPAVRYIAQMLASSLIHNPLIRSHLTALWTLEEESDKILAKENNWNFCPHCGCHWKKEKE